MCHYAIYVVPCNDTLLTSIWLGICFSVLQETKKKIQKMKDYQDKLLETLGDVLEEHFPLPQNETAANKKKKVLPLCSDWSVCFKQCTLRAFTKFDLVRLMIGKTKFRWWHFKIVSWLSVFFLSSLWQNIPQELNDNLISLNEILEASPCTVLMPYTHAIHTHTHTHTSIDHKHVSDTPPSPVTPAGGQGAFWKRTLHSFPCVHILSYWWTRPLRPLMTPT